MGASASLSGKLAPADSDSGYFSPEGRTRAFRVRPDHQASSVPESITDVGESPHNVQRTTLDDPNINVEGLENVLVEKYRMLESQLAACESSNLELSERVAWLEDQLQDSYNKASQVQLYEKTIEIRKQDIQRLETELKLSQEELQALKLKHKKKVRRLQMNLVEARQEAAITIMELQEKMRSMMEANQASRECFSPEHHSGEGNAIVPHDKRHNLIVELSSKLCQEQDRIKELEKTLELKEQHIKDLEAESQHDKTTLTGTKTTEKHKMNGKTEKLLTPVTTPR